MKLGNRYSLTNNWKTFRRAVARSALATALGFGVLAHAHSAAAQSATASAPQAQAPTLELEVGEQRLISASDVRSYSEGIPGVVDVRLTDDGKDFVVVAMQPGRTTLLLLKRKGGDQLYRIKVTDRDQPPQPETVATDSRVRARDNVRLDFYFVQIDRSYGHQLGINYPGQISGGTLSAEFGRSGLAFLSGVVEQPLPRLDLAQTTGWAKLMRHATVVTANGSQAQFGGGGEVNVSVQSSVATGIHSIEYGSRIGVLPRYDKLNGRLDLEVEARVSDLRPGGGNVPGRSTSELKTAVNLALGESLVLAGLTSDSQSTARTGLPGLSQIPLLGALFGSNSQRREQTETLIFIVPTVQDAGARQAEARLLKTLQRYRHYEGKASQHLRRSPGRANRPAAKPTSERRGS